MNNYRMNYNKRPPSPPNTDFNRVFKNEFFTIRYADTMNPDYIRQDDFNRIKRLAINKYYKCNKFKELLTKYNEIQIVKTLRYDYKNTRKGLHFNAILYNQTTGERTEKELHIYVLNGEISRITTLTDLI